MVLTSPDTYEASIPFFGFGRTIHYKVVAIDGSAAANTAVNPTTGTRMIYAKYSPGGTVTIGTGTTGSSTVGPTYISGTTSTYLWSNHISMFTPAEIGFTGALSTISWYKTDAQGYNLNNGVYRIYLKHTTAAAVASTVGTFATELAGATLVYENLAQNLPLSAGWVDFVLTNPNAFSYNGTSNLMVLVYWYRPGSPTGAVPWQYTTATGMACTWSSATDPPNITYGNGSRPNIKMTFVTPSNLTADAGIGQIVYPTGGVIANTSFNVIAKIKNYGTDTLTAATVNWTVDGVLQTPFSWTGTVLQNALSSDITLGSLTLPLGVHEIKIWTDNPNGVGDMNFGNDTMKISFMACASLLSGTYTIGGAGADFPTFSAAMIALDQCGINGPVTFNVASGTYAEQVNVPFISGASALNPVIFQSATGDSTDVVLQFTSLGAAANYTLKFDDAAFVTFQKMTIRSQSASFSRVIDISGTSSNLTIVNCVIEGVANAPKTTNAQHALVYSGDDQNNHITVTNSKLIGGEHGVWFKGLGGMKETGTMISHNHFGGQTNTSITLNDHVAPTVQNNVIQIANSVDLFRGIYVVNSEGVIGIKSNQVIITDAVTARGIEVSGIVTDSMNPGLIANNMVSVNVNLSGSTALSPAGIAIHNSSHQNVYYNSVNIYGGSTASNTAFWYSGGTTYQGIQLQNNNLVNQILGGVTIDIQGGASNSSYSSNYNNLYAIDGHVGRIGANNQTTLSAWQSVSGKDLNSFVIKPYFNSNTDLHTFNGMLNGLATPITSITTDIDGDPRDPVNPDPGADEFDPPAIDVALLEILSPVGGCRMTATEPVTLLLKNVGTDTITSGLTANFRFNGSSTVVTENILTTIFPGDSLVHTFATTVNMDVYLLGVADTFELHAWTSLLGDFVPFNDSIWTELPSLYTPLPPTVTDDTILYSATSTLFALSTDTVVWYQHDTSTVELHTGATFITPPLFQNTTYWVAASSGAPQASGPYTPGPNIAPSSTVSASNCSTGPCSAFNDLNFGTCGTQLVWVSTSNPPSNVPHTNWIDFEWVAPVTIDGMTIHHAQTTLRFLTGAELYYWDAGAWVYFHTFTNLPMQCESVVPFPLVTTTKFRITTFQMTGSGQTSNPNFREIEVHEGKSLGCESVRVPVTVYVGPPPPEDAGIVQVVHPAGSVPSGVMHPVTVELRNYGLDTLHNVKIFWALNNVLQDSLSWTGVLLQDSTTILTIDSVILAGGNYCVKSWTAMPNGVTDIIPLNDTSETCFNACMAGTYTIGPATTGTWDFSSFNSALSTLISSGICGHVTFEVQPGTYTEQLTIPAVTGMDANNTVTFKGATNDSTAVTLQFAATSTTDNWVVRLNGARFFTFSHMTLKATGSANGRVVEFMTNASDNTIHNCVIETNTNATGSTFTGIYSTTGNNIHRATFANNRFIGGYYSIYWYGSSASRKNNVKILNNVLVDYYYSGIYTYYADSLFINGNSLTNRTGSAIVYGMYLYYTNGYGEVTKNRLHLSGTSSQYGITVGQKQATSSLPLIVANNYVTQSGATGTVYAIYLLTANYVDVYHNSVRVGGGSTTAGRAFFLSSGTFVNVVNNIFSNHAGGVAYYVTTPSNVGVSNHNNFYSTATNLAYWGANYNTLAALQAASQKDQNSHNLVPPFTSATDLFLTNSDLSGKGTYLPQVPDDIYGSPRSLLPTIGAHEIPLIANDAGVIAITSPGTQTNEGQTYPVQVTVANFGTDPIYTMDIQYTVNGGPPVNFTFNDTILPAGTKQVTLPSMVSPAGTSVICARTILLNDSNNFNDQFCKTFFGVPLYDAQVDRIVGLTDGCGLGLDTISIWVKNLGVNAINSPSPNVVTVSYQIDNGIPVTENFTPVVPPTDSVLFHFATQANFGVTLVSDTFKVKAWISLTGDNVSYNDTAYNQVISLHTPAPPIVNDDTIPYGSSTTIFAQSPDSIFWFSSQTATTEIATGAYFNTPILYNNTTYWVQAGTDNFEGGLSVFTTMAAGNSFAGNMFDIMPTEAITLDSFDVNIIAGAATVEVYYRPGTYVGFTGSSAGWTLVGSANVTGNGSGVPTRVPVGGLTLQPGQTYGLYITVTAGTMYYTNVTQGLIQTGPDFSLMFGHGGGYPFSLTNAGRQWNGRIYYTKGTLGCASTRVPVNIVVANQLACDVGLMEINQPTSAVNLTSQETVSVKVRNYGTAAQSNIPVRYQIGNNPVVTETLAGPLGPNDSVNYVFSTQANLSTPGTTYQFKAWTGLSCDVTGQNDTLWKSVTNLLPNYCNSTATSALYSEITNVTLGTMSHNSAATGAMYTNHTATAQPPMVSPGINYNFSITSGFAPGTSTIYSCWTKAWIDFNRDGVFDPATEEVFSQATNNNSTVTGTIQIPGTAMTGTTRMRVVLNQTTSAAAVTPCNTYTYGETEDYSVMIAPQAPCDAGVTQIISPVALTQSGTTLPVWIRFMNFGSNPIAAGTLSIAYKLNNGTPVVVAYPGGLAVGASDSILMPSITLPIGNNTFCAYTILACDSNSFNNEICMGLYGQYQTTLPYFDDFETSNMWYKPAISTNWQYGTPSANIINTAYSGNKAWVTNLTGDYSNSADEYLYTPLFSFAGLSGLDTITLSFWHWNAMAASDYGRVQYSINGGQTWSTLGFYLDPSGTNWYNVTSGGLHYFSHTNSGWMNSSFKLSPAVFNGQPEVQFRFQLWSNASGTSNGWAIDNFSLALPVVNDDVGISAINVPLGDTAVGTTVNAVVTIKNYGSNVQNMIPVQLRVNGNLITSETWTGTLPSQGTTQYTFVIPFTVPNASYQLCAKTDLPNDPFALNDEACKSLGVLPAFHDVGVTAILSPTPDSVGMICFWDSLTHMWYKKDVIVRIKNFGQNTQTSIPVRYTFQNGGAVHNDTWTGTLLPDSTVDYTLQTQFAPILGAQQVCVETALIGDPVTTNNKACQSYIGRTCIGVDDLVRDDMVLKQNIPNPAGHTSLIGYTIPTGGKVTFGLVNMIGQTILNNTQTQTAGNHEVEVDVSALSPGVYYYFIEFQGHRLTRKMIVSR